MSYCPQCGVQNPDAARFCDQCGASLVPVSGAAGAPVAAPVSSAPPSYTASAPVAAAPAVAPASAGTLICPQCGASAIPGEAFCDNCGAPLNAPARAAAPVPSPPYSPSVPPQPSYPLPQPSVPAASARPAATAVTPVPPTASAPVAPVVPATAMSQRTTLAPASLIIAATGATLTLPLAASAVIGRADPVSKFMPDIDLTPQGALEQGVGRRHARLAVQADQITIEDLDSTNGTSINGRKLTPRQPTALQNGDTVHVGRLEVRIHY